MPMENRTEEDWFLRGGERPQAETPCAGPQVPDGDLQDADAGDEIEYDVSMVRTKTVRQRCRVTVVADCEESAMEKAEELAEDEGDGWPWEDEDNSTEYEDCEAESAEEH